MYISKISELEAADQNVQKCIKNEYAGDADVLIWLMNGFRWRWRLEWTTGPVILFIKGKLTTKQTGESKKRKFAQLQLHKKKLFATGLGKISEFEANCYVQVEKIPVGEIECFIFRLMIWAKLLNDLCEINFAPK